MGLVLVIWRRVRVEKFRINRMLPAAFKSAYPLYFQYETESPTCLCAR